MGSSNSRRLWLKRNWPTDGKCYLCGGEMRLEWGYQDSATIDHVKPRFMLPPHLYNSKSNKKIACWQCNNEKSIEEHKLKCEIDAKLENPQESINLKKANLCQCRPS